MRVNSLALAHQNNKSRNNLPKTLTADQDRTIDTTLDSRPNLMQVQVNQQTEEEKRAESRVERLKRLHYES